MCNKPSTKKTKMICKGILRKDGIIYSKKSLQFQDKISETIPIDLNRSNILPYDLFQQRMRRNWKDVSFITVEHAARILQQFARKNMPLWIQANEQRTELQEEVHSMDELLAADLEWLQWEKEDMLQQARLEVQMEQEDAPAQVCSQAPELLSTIIALQEEVRAVKKENKKIKANTKSLKKDNKKQVNELKEQALEVEMRQFKLSMFEGNCKLVQGRKDKCLPNNNKWHDNLDKENAQWQLRHKQGHAYRDTCLKVMEAIKVACPKKKSSGLMLEIMCQDFASQGKQTLAVSSFKASINASRSRGATSDKHKNHKSKERHHKIKHGSPKKDTIIEIDRKKKRGSMRRICSERTAKGTLKKDRKTRRSKTDGELGALNKMKKAKEPISERRTEASQKKTKTLQSTTHTRKSYRKDANLASESKISMKKRNGSNDSMAAEQSESNFEGSFDWESFSGSYNWATQADESLDQESLSESYNWASQIDESLGQGALSESYNWANHADESLDQVALGDSFDWTAHASRQHLDLQAVCE